MFLKRLIIIINTISALLCCLTAITADFIGIGNPGWSHKQTKLLILGLILFTFSTYLSRKSPEYFRKILNKIKQLFNYVLGILIEFKPNKYDVIISSLLLIIGIVTGSLFLKHIQTYNYISYFYPSTTGIDFLSISSLKGGIFYGITAVMLFSLFRQSLGKTFSLLGTILVSTSPIHLYNLIPAITRDYAKAPIFLFIILISIVIVTRSHNNNIFIFLCCIVGISIGFGLLVRKDFFITYILFIIALIFLPGKNINGIFTKMAGLLLTVILSIFVKVSFGESHDEFNRGAFSAVAGLQQYFDTRLGIKGAENYTWGYNFDDYYTSSISNLQVAASSNGNSLSFSYYGPHIDYWIKILINFPADVLVRAYASVIKVIELPFSYNYLNFPLENALVIDYYELRSLLHNMLIDYAIFFVFAALTIISTVNYRIALFLFFVILFLGGYPSLQFSARHYFHFEFISWWGFLFVLEKVLFQGRRSVKYIFGK